MNVHSTAILLLALLCAGTAGAEPPVFFRGELATTFDYPFSEAVRVGDLLFLSGQIGTRPGGEGLVAGGISTETRQILANIRDVLERHGSSMDRVVKCTVFMADMTEWPAMNAEYKKAFAPDFPARSALGASGLALAARAEIECIAAL